MPASLDYALIRLVVENGHVEIVKLLSQASDPKAGGPIAIKIAATNGHVEVVKLLLPLSDIAQLVEARA